MIRDLWLVLTGRLSMDKIHDKDLTIASLIDDIRYQRELLNRLEPLLNGVARIIATHDPTFGKDELDPQLKAKSDAIAKPIINRLKADAAARRHQEGR